MGTHLIPRSNVKGQDRFFIFFSLPGLVGTIICARPALMVFSFLDKMGYTVVGFILIAIFGGIGFVIGQGKIPDSGSLPIFKAVGGLYVKDVIVMYLKFRNNKKKFVLEMSKDQTFEEKQESDFEKIVLNKLW